MTEFVSQSHFDKDDNLNQGILGNLVVESAAGIMDKVLPTGLISDKTQNVTTVLYTGDEGQILRTKLALAGKVWSKKVEAARLFSGAPAGAKLVIKNLDLASLEFPPGEKASLWLSSTDFDWTVNKTNNKEGGTFTDTELDEMGISQWSIRVHVVVSPDPTIATLKWVAIPLQVGDLSRLPGDAKKPGYPTVALSDGEANMTGAPDVEQQEASLVGIPFYPCLVNEAGPSSDITIPSDEDIISAMKVFWRSGTTVRNMKLADWTEATRGPGEPSSDRGTPSWAWPPAEPAEQNPEERDSSEPSEVSNMNGTLSGSLMLKNSTRVEDVSTRVSSDKKGHVLVEVGMPGEPLSEGLKPSHPDDNETLIIHAGTPEGCAHCGPGKGVFSVDIKTRDDENYLSVARSHLGPVMVTDTLSEITMYLPSPRVFAPTMDSFMWNGRKHNFTFNLGPSSSQVHLPMVMAQHPDQNWTIIYLDTEYPGEIIVTPGSANQPLVTPNQQKGPLVTWRTMGGSIKLHIFVGIPVKDLNNPMKTMKTSLEVVVEQFHSYLNDNPRAPPYWAYGYHICRSGMTPSQFLKDVEGMGDTHIPYDTDCVDEMLVPTAFNINPHEDYDVSVLTDRENPIGLLLPQVIQTSTDSLAPPPACIQSNSTECIEGFYNGENVTFPDPYSGDFPGWVKDNYNNMSIKHVGVQVLATYPSNLPVYAYLNESCILPPYVPSSLDIDEDTLCPQSALPTDNSHLLQHHAGYSKQVIQSFSNVVSEQFLFSDTFMLGSKGAFLGSSFPSSWEGLNQTLREVLFLGLAGASMITTPVCGTTPPSISVPQPELLCLRWFQLASFFPSLRSHYSSNTNLPYTYSIRTYQQYVRWSLHTHYKLLPYLHSLQLEWTTTGFPAVRAMFLDHPDLPFQKMWSQFKVGRDILVAPVLHPDVDLVPVQLPHGTWYTLNSGNLFSTTGGSFLVHTHLDEIPAFQRGGSILLTHETAFFGLEATLSSSNYTMMAAVECQPDPRFRKTCQAATSQHIGGDNNLPIIVSVTANATTGNVDINIGPGVDIAAADGVKSLGSVELFGLEQGGNKLFVTIGNDTIEAEEDFSTDGSKAWYDVDKQRLIVRDIGLEWRECFEGGCQGYMKWEFMSP